MNIRLILDIENNDWILDDSKINPGDDYVDLYFAFRKDGDKKVVFDNLKFGFSVSIDGTILGSANYPNSGIEYVATDQDYLEVYRMFGFRPNRTYTVEAWAENALSSFSETLSITIPIPNQPYPSWSWNDSIAQWEPPFQPPDDGNMYSWNEATQSWDLVVIE